MKKSYKILLLISIIALGIVIAVVFGTQKEIMPMGSSLPKLGYVSSKGSGFISIKNKPLMVMYFKPDCPHCEYELKTMNNRITEMNGMDIIIITTDKKYIQDAVFNRWNNLAGAENVEFGWVDQKDYDEKIGINVTPVFIFFNTNGKLINKIIGETKFDRLLEPIRRSDGSKRQSGGIN